MYTVLELGCQVQLPPMVQSSTEHRTSGTALTGLADNKITVLGSISASTVPVAQNTALVELSISTRNHNYFFVGHRHRYQAGTYRILQVTLIIFMSKANLANKKYVV